MRASKKSVPSLNKWFQSKKGALDVLMADVKPFAESSISSIANATHRMGEAVAGRFGRRAPVFVTESGVILDGKATFHALKEKGVTHIRVTTDHPVKREIERRQALASEVLPILTSATERIAQRVGGTSNVGPVKEIERSLIKTFKENDGDVSALRDIFRSTVIAPVSAMQNAVSEIQRGFQIVGPISDKVKNPVFGFRGYKANVRLSTTRGGSEIVEMQVVSPEVAKYAKRRGHAILETLRNEAESRFSRQSPFDENRLVRLREESEQGFNRAWEIDNGAARSPEPVFDEFSGSYVSIGKPPSPTPSPLPSAFPQRPRDPFFGP